MDPLQWMGAVRIRVQTADKYITIIHTTPVNHVWSEKLHISKKHIHQGILTSNIASGLNRDIKLNYSKSILYLWRQSQETLRHSRYMIWLILRRKGDSTALQYIFINFFIAVGKF